MIRSHRASSRRLLLLALLAATGLTTACDDDPTGTGDEAEVTVMTRNLYLGGDVFELVGAPAEEVPVIAAELFATVQANDFEARAGAIAAEIEATEPHLVGLQEVSLYRTQDPSDYVQGTTEANAETVFIDYLDVLMDSLDARGLNYRVVAQVQNADVEVPAARSQTEFFDVRLTDRDVILARSDVEIDDTGAKNFGILAPLTVGGRELEFLRGYTWAEAEVDDVEFTFVNVHLEVSAGGQLTQVQSAQAYELVGAFGGTGPTIVVGDLNTEPGEEPYGIVTGTFQDAWTELGTGGEGLTCCQPPVLFESEPLTSRIDLILYRGDVEVLSAQVVGDETADRTDEGLWPSDHAGVVATLRVED